MPVRRGLLGIYTPAAGKLCPRAKSIGLFIVQAGCLTYHEEGCPEFLSRYTKAVSGKRTDQGNCLIVRT